MKAIETHKLTKYYGRSRGIDSLDLSVEKGEFFGFIGPNGAGKSTTIRLLLGLISPTSGSASVMGKSVTGDSTEILKNAGYLPSEAIFYSGMKVKDVIKLSADLRKKDCSAEAKRLCERLGLETEKKVDDLSFGNRKKVGIVCALQSDPELLILDEPTGGLDPLMQKEFFDILSEKNEKGTTVFLSSHVLHEVQKYCRRAAVISEGKLIACDSVDKLSHTSAKRVTLRGKIDLSGLEGVKDLKTSGDSTGFLYGGGIKELLRKLNESEIYDVTVSEPDLEEIFLHFYGKGGDGK